MEKERLIAFVNWILEEKEKGSFEDAYNFIDKLEYQLERLMDNTQNNGG